MTMVLVVQPNAAMERSTARAEVRMLTSILSKRPCPGLLTPGPRAAGRSSVPGLGQNTPPPVRTTKLSIAVVFAIGFASTNAGAEEERPTRRGFVIGGALGGGVIWAGCENCDVRASIGLDFHLGGMLSPRLALLF